MIGEPCSALCGWPSTSAPVPRLTSTSLMDGAADYLEQIRALWLRDRRAEHAAGGEEIVRHQRRAPSFPLDVAIIDDLDRRQMASIACAARLGGNGACGGRQIVAEANGDFAFDADTDKIAGAQGGARRERPWRTRRRAGCGM